MSYGETDMETTRTRTTRFGLIRHAQTRWNKEKRIQGWLDSPLSTVGRRMAESWGRELHDLAWQRIVCSDLGRARETTKLLNQTLKLPVHPDKRLREQDWGKWNGMTLAELKRGQAETLRQQEAAGWLFQPPGGESRQQVLERSLAALHAAHLAWPGETILVVCHGGVIKCLLYHLAGRSFLPHELRLLKGYRLHLLEQLGRTLYLEELNSRSLHR